jgi:hypothetical protein
MLKQKTANRGKAKVGSASAFPASSLKAIVGIAAGLLNFFYKKIVAVAFLV